MDGRAHNQSYNLQPSSLDVESLTTEEFDVIAQLIQDKAGIEIVRKKIGMVEGRLRKRVRELKLNNFSQYIQYIKRKGSENEEIQRFVNALTTNKTEFFREHMHFDYLSSLLRQQAKARTVYIWSAACSSGEEVYSLAIMCENLRAEMPAFDYRLLGSDIDTQCLHKASTGIYDQSSLTNVSPIFRQKYFNSVCRSSDGQVKIKDILKKRIKFRQYNLIEEERLMSVKFDFIFLRNVLFYFPRHTVKRIVRNISQYLKPGGLIFISLTETLNSLDTGLDQVSSSIYQKKIEK